MDSQYIIVAAIVFSIILWQVYSFALNLCRIKRLQKIFPKQDHNRICTNEDGSVSIVNVESSKDFKQTLDDINSYLAKNKNRSTDYHIIKEIVNRNVEEAEEEVDAMLSAPLYLGLMATIAGVAIGVVFFAWEDLGNLLTGENIQIDGIKTLLTDIGIAMIASFLGVLFTKISTAKFKNAKSVMSKNKNKFLTWIQTELMPNLTDDLMGALIKMTQDLNEFNASFANNTRELKETLSLVSDNYENQIEILEVIDRLKINKIAQANIEVYDKLHGCTTEIERLFQHLSNSERYIQEVVTLNQQLGSIEERTRSFEELGTYFKDELQFVNDRQGMMRQSMSGLDSVIQEALTNLGNSVGQSINALTDVFQKQNQNVQLLIEEQQKSLGEALVQQRMVVNQTISEFSDPFSNLKDLFAEISQQAKQGLDEITATFVRQNEAIAQMLQNQKNTLESELKEQRITLLEKLSDSPNVFSCEQQTVLTDIANTMGKLNAYLESQIVSKERNNRVRKWMNVAMVCGACGSFVILLVLLIIKLFGLGL